MIPDTEKMRDALRSHFGYDSFRPLQKEIISHVVNGADALVIMPTGAGKSLCYQIPALVSDGMALVVSPLIALMRDQVVALRTNGIKAAAINSAIPADELHMIHKAIEDGDMKMLYVSPEKLLTPRFRRYIQDKSLSLIAIDEAHCVSVWGNDFRPEYAQLHKIISQFPKTPVLALTATADKATQTDIVKQLGLRKPRRFLASFERKNIAIHARPGQRRLEHILEFLGRHEDQPGIIYCLSRRSTEQLAMKLSNYGFRAKFYHAEVSPEFRKQVQDAFQRDEIQIVCATIAFGMGIDKANIRWVIHYNMPKNIESYYQEIGRAGRDGADAEALMFYSLQEVFVYRRFMDESNADARFKQVQMRKLDRILEFARASSCRTNIILNYFGEYRSKPCGHCDNCLRPPSRFDGSELTKQAISVCKEAGGKVGIFMLVDILRGSNRRDLRARKLHTLPSYGTGTAISRDEWVWYINQMINQGHLEIDYTDNANLKCTPLSELVLQSIERVTLYQPMEATSIDVHPRQTSSTQFERDLLKNLRAIRDEMALEYDIPAYLIISDQALVELAKEKPLTPEDLGKIPGISQFKVEQYGKAIVGAIRDFLITREHLPRFRGRSQLETLAMLREGHTAGQIAVHRGMKLATILSHLAQLYTWGEDIDLMPYIEQSEISAIRSTWIETGRTRSTKDLHEAMGGIIGYDKIRLGLAIIEKEEVKKQVREKKIP